MTRRTLFAVMLACATVGAAAAAAPAAAESTSAGSPADECIRLATPPVPLSITAAEEKAKPVDWPHAIDLCEDAVKADPGAARLRYLLGNAYFVTKNYLLALRHLEAAADAGYPDAEDELGVMFVRGLGVIKDYQRAFDLFNKAAAGGSPTGMGNLGSMYASGFFVKEDDAQALGWYEKSIEAGNAFGLAQAGVLYFNGKGTLRDYKMAAGYFQQAADLGDGYSLKFLAIMYERGLLGKPDPAKAAELRLKAAEVDPDSQNPDVSPPEPPGAHGSSSGHGGGAGRPGERYQRSGGGGGDGYIRHAYGLVGVWGDPNANRQGYTGAVKRAPTWHNIPIALPRCWPFCQAR